MSRRNAVLSLLALAAGALSAPRAALAQARGKVTRIGYVTMRSRGHALEAEFVAGMRELGYVEGKNIAIEWRYAEGKVDRLPALAAELVALRVDLIVAVSTQAIQAAAAATTTIPVVFPASSDPVGAGLVKSLARPGGNVTGLSTIAADLGAKQIELLKLMLPRLSRIAVLLNPSNAGNPMSIRNFEAGAKKAGVSVLQFEAASPEGIERAFPAMVAARADAVTLAIDAFFLQEATRITALALRHKLPFISTQVSDAEAGSLMSYGGAVAENYRRVATYIDKILKGAKPADLPIEQPMRVEMVLNLKTAKALGIKVPQSLLLRADRVIE
ncbi:MAG: ABC transporter substrate-binding protein [Betaproteobacteria bacterium]|nr:ABC transporter substrate-binding protein [Betaproteobacteria bacterium]